MINEFTLRMGNYDGAARQAGALVFSPEIKNMKSAQMGNVIEVRSILSTLKGLFRDYDRPLSVNQARGHALSLYKLLSEKGEGGKSFSERELLTFPTMHSLNGIRDVTKKLDDCFTPKQKEMHRICMLPHEFTWVPFSIHENGLFCLWSWNRRIPTQEWLNTPLFVIRGTVVTILDFLRGCRDQQAHLNPDKYKENPMIYMSENFTVRMAFTLSAAFMVALVGCPIGVNFEEEVSDSCLICSARELLPPNYAQKIFERWYEK